MKRWIPWTATLVVVALLAAGGLRTVKSRQAARAVAAAPAAPVLRLLPSDVVRAQLRELPDALPISGTLRAVDSAFVKARVAGELSGLTVREGDPVKAGQVIARVDPTESQSRLRQAQQQASSAQAQVDMAQRTLDNNSALVKQGFISKNALDTSQSNLDAARASFLAAQAGVELARKALADTVLRSPIDGHVSQRLAQTGERVAVDAKVIEVVDLRRIEMEATLGAVDSISVRVGQPALLQVEGRGNANSASSAADSANRHDVRATVARINPSAQAGSRSVLVYLTLERSEGFRQGLFAEGTIELGRSQAVALPLAAVRVDKPEPYVQVIDDGRVAHRAVKLGARTQVGDQTLVRVLDGLADGTQALAGSVGPVPAGTQVRVERAAP